MANELLRVENLCAGYGAGDVVRSASLSLHRGEICALNCCKLRELKGRERATCEGESRMNSEKCVYGKQFAARRRFLRGLP